jgi:electron transfer flavoprotein alpha subunit
MSGVLIYSERDELAHDLLAWAATRHDQLGELSAAVLGADAARRSESYRGYGASRIFFDATSALASLQDDVIAPALADIVRKTGADLVILGATRRGRSLAPRLAQLLDAGCVSEAIELEFDAGRLVTGRYSLGGNTIARESIRTTAQVIAVAPGTVERSTPGPATGETVAYEPSLAVSRATVVEHRAKPATETNISASDRLVCVGRGLASKDDLPLLKELAEAIGAELACTRPLSYEYGWLTEDRMIGISGAKCSPRLLVSVGVSGQVQHTVGIQGAKTIVAINTERSAPIFKLADYAIIGDLYEVVPRLSARLRERGAGSS